MRRGLIRVHEVGRRRLLPEVGRTSNDAQNTPAKGNEI